MKTLISPSTKRNWEKLGTDGSDRLMKRANKTSSEKRILPVEYVTDPSSIALVRRLTEENGERIKEPERLLCAVAEALLRERGILEKPHVQAVLQEYLPEGGAKLTTFAEGEIPTGERDLLGLLYQSMLPEGQKNQCGSYYTPHEIVTNMTADLVFSEGQTFLDPCCGSGSFLLALDNAKPEQLYGFDRDPVAVMIAKVNLLLKYPDRVFVPQILCLDYLENGTAGTWQSGQQAKYYDYIATNPPWGALVGEGQFVSGVASKETFSGFFMKAYEQLKDGGKIRFLFPEAIFQAKMHRGFRTFLLENCHIERITRYDSMFSGVSTGVIDISCLRESPEPHLYLCDRDSKWKIPLSVFRETKNCVFCFPTKDEYRVLRRIREMGRYDLSDSIWALGIVTGDNKGKLKSVMEDGCEAIYTGKEIERYTLKPARKYLHYDRSNLQQVAREEYYRAPEKLVYRFVSNRLIFAYDNSKSLFLNSANILIPRIPNMGIKTVLAFLNSDLFQFFYTRIFGDIKVLRGNLEELPFPRITEEQDLYLEQLTERIIAEEAGLDSALQKEIFSLYGLSEEQIALVRKSLSMV